MLTIAGERAVDDTVACLVRGPASRYPRGYVWLVPIWFLVLSGVVALVSVSVSGTLPLWLGVSEIGGLLLATCTAACVLLTATRMAFWADQRGILLGSRRQRRRPKLRQVYLPWPDVAQVRMVPRRYGVLVELLLSPAAPPVYRPSLPSQASLLLGALVMPIGVGRGRPALTMPRMQPPAYRVRVCERADQLSGALRLVAPENVPVRVLASMAALRLTSPRRPRLPRPPQPPNSPRRLGQYVPRRAPTATRRR
jgi:hypothetical protein